MLSLKNKCVAFIQLGCVAFIQLGTIDWGTPPPAPLGGRPPPYLKTTRLIYVQFGNARSPHLELASAVALFYDDITRRTSTKHWGSIVAGHLPPALLIPVHGVWLWGTTLHENFLPGTPPSWTGNFCTLIGR